MPLDPNAMEWTPGKKSDAAAGAATPCPGAALPQKRERCARNAPASCPFEVHGDQGGAAPTGPERDEPRTQLDVSDRHSMHSAVAMWRFAC